MDPITKFVKQEQRRVEAARRKFAREAIQRQQKLKKMVDAIYHYAQENPMDFMYDADGIEAGPKKLEAIFQLGMMYETPAERKTREAAFNAMMSKI